MWCSAYTVDENRQLMVRKGPATPVVIAFRPDFDYLPNPEPSFSKLGDREWMM